MTDVSARPLIAIACGGTGGHIFPGVAVAEELVSEGCDVRLFVSPKEVDQKAAKTLLGFDVQTLPAVPPKAGWPRFLASYWAAYHLAKTNFAGRPPHAALSMGGFAS